jgi:hypothetical protein
MKILKFNLFNENSHQPSIDDIKSRLKSIAISNRKTDSRSNFKYWSDTIKDIDLADTEDKLLSIAEFDFGFNSLQEIFE